MATLTVTNGNDSGPGSLRDTIARAASGDRIEFAFVSTINISTGAIKINKNLIIDASVLGYVTINGQYLGAIFNMTTVNVTLSKLRIAYGKNSTILNVGGELTVVDCEVRNNLDVAIYNMGGTLNITNSTLSDNRADYGGGAVYNESGTLNIKNSTLSDNSAVYGGAVYNNRYGTVTITECKLSANSSFSNGGAIYNQQYGSVTITASTLSDNTGVNVGAIYNDGTLTIQDNSMLSGNKVANDGGAIYNDKNGSVTITASTLSDNNGIHGGAIYNDGTLTIQDNSMLSGNKGATNGGAIYNDKNGSVTITASTLSDNITDNITGNNGGAVFNKGIFTIIDKSSLSANNAKRWGGALHNDLNGTFTIEGSSLTDNVAFACGAISNDGTLVINNSTLSGNKITSSSVGGGAIGNSGTLTITDCNLTANSDGVVANDGQLTIAESTISENKSNLGGAIYNFNKGVLIVKTSKLSNNFAYASGGAIYNEKSSSVTIEQSILSGNSSGSDYGPGDGGAIYNEGTLTIRANSTLSDNVGKTDGGAIYNIESGSVTITASTLSGNNTGNNGGAVFNKGIFTIKDKSTLSANIGINGGAIYNLGTFTIQDNSTLSGNMGKTDGGAIYNEESGSITIEQSILSGNSSDDGGAIVNQGTLTIKDNCTLSANTASRQGGAIYNNQNGIFTITDSHLLGNKAIDGGAIFNNDTALAIASSITNTELRENNASNGNYKGGAVYNNGTLLISNSILSANGKTGFCGAISNHGHITIEKCTLSDNEGYFGGAINTDGILIVRNSTLDKNTAKAGSGGAIYITGATSNTRIDSSTLLSNDAAFGGAIYTDNAGPLTIINSTLSQNAVMMAGDALFSSGGTLDILFSTIADNPSSGFGAVICDKNTTTTFRSSILANPLPNCFAEGGSTITGIGQNLCTDESCPGSIVVSQDHLKLEPLAMNPPGTTQTYALQEGSVAINIVEACNVAYDQRGVLRPKSGADAGAYEKVQELLAISENASPEHPVVAQQFTYTINIHNLALVPLTNVLVTDKIPAQFDFITASEGYSFDPATREVTWPPATIEVDQPLTVTVTVLPRNAGTFINSVTAAITDYPTTIDNYPTIVYERKMLAIDNEASPENPTVGYPFIYTINVRNTGQSLVKHITVTDKLPDSVDIVTSSEQHLIRSGGEVTWTLDALSQGQSVTLTLKVKPRLVGSITNTITATSPDSETAVCTYQTEVKAAMTFAVNIQTITSWSYPAELRSCGLLCSLDEFLKLSRFKLVTLHTLGGWAVTGLVVDYDDCIVRLTEAILS